MSVCLYISKVLCLTNLLGIENDIKEITLLLNFNQESSLFGSHTEIRGFKLAAILKRIEEKKRIFRAEAMPRTKTTPRK